MPEMPPPVARIGSKVRGRKHALERRRSDALVAHRGAEGSLCLPTTAGQAGPADLCQDMETDEQPLLNRFGYRPDDLPPEIRGGYRGVGERWKPDVS